jgi:hypothetical protein
VPSSDDDSASDCKLIHPFPGGKLTRQSVTAMTTLRALHPSMKMMKREKTGTSWKPRPSEVSCFTLDFDTKTTADLSADERRKEPGGDDSDDGKKKKRR